MKQTVMKQTVICLTAFLTLTLPLFAQNGPAPLPQDVLEKVSYSMGLGVSQQIAQQEEDMDIAPLVSGVKDAMSQSVDTEKVLYAEGVGMATQMAQRGLILEEVLAAIEDSAAGKDPKFTEEELQAAGEEAQKFMQAQQAAMQAQQQQQQQAQQAAAEDNLEAGQTFLAENAGKDGVMTTLSGLQYKVIEEGEGEKPELNDMVTVHYTGKLLDGTVFDSSVERGTPAEFPLVGGPGGLIQGWVEGIQLMSPGATYRFWIPANLAYSEQAPPAIGPNQVLDFEIELIEVK